jgi:hypothetical protein
VQRTHLYVLCVHKRRRSKTPKSKFLPFIFLNSLMENSRKCILFGPHQIPQGTNVVVPRLIARKMGKRELGMENLD